MASLAQTEREMPVHGLPPVRPFQKPRRVHADASNCGAASHRGGRVWGVGRRIAKQLQDAGIHTVLDLARMDPATIRRRWSVTLERTVRELQGQPCIELDDAPQSKQQIACTRSFGQPVSDLAPLLEAVSVVAPLRRPTND